MSRGENTYLRLLSAKVLGYAKTVVWVDMKQNNEGHSVEAMRKLKTLLKKGHSS